MKKMIISLTVAAGVMGLGACSNDNADSSEVIVESKAGNITKEELYQSMKEKYGEQALQEMLYQKVLSKNYKVTDKEVEQKVAELKEELGDNFELVLQQNQLKDEEELKAVLKDQLLMEKAALKDVKVSEAEVKKRYEEYKPEIKASHILVKDEATAKEVKKKLDEGAKFEDLAKEYSQDPGSAANGGDLGFFGPGKMVPEFEEAAYALDVNEISGPVKSQHGFHIIKVTEKKEKESYDKMKDKLEYDLKLAQLDSNKIQEVLKRELDKANVKIKDKDLKGAAEFPEAEAPTQP
ncbi:peptidylprolyl isomerase [Mesobacillus sp. AQ2]|jgi:foldase protein PrsA|uniref:peptidylprolyl isomerase n=1 Tax=Bacillaceae TaxID=186817 RepID=UPI0011A88D54|nr:MULTISPECIES: peptidylprolyl isomerase [Bacillaceae]MCM3125316.1 peptidylprolyl isomerase [Mesobacillus sp. MER 33]MCM3235455.1 peptidylprolyl isomerase [Mesobacillus sp. MER 48]WHX41800.1 peptidylprolyl isomerase [Mesobacillus sp. AQ2]